MHCIKCGAAVPDGAAFCPGCGAPQKSESGPWSGHSAKPEEPLSPTTAPATVVEKPEEKRNVLGGCVVATVVALLLLGLIGTCAGDPNGNNQTSTTGMATNIPDVDEAASSANQGVMEENGRANLTASQRNAVRSAEQYLSISGFSRRGLIDQLSSDAGEGYSVSDATAAVDSLSVDWNENAARSARQYLSISGFSCKGLIQQLSASAGDKYTVEQATYGARQASAC